MTELREKVARVIKAAQAYFDGYCQDEAADDGCDFTGCSEGQHLAAKELGEALGDVSLDQVLNLIGGGGWRIIETAPKDGTPILIWGNHKGDEHLTSGAIVGCWNVMTDAGGWRAYGDFVPTHWSPLPPPPQEPKP